jgi:hypothetical protein
LMLSRIHRIRFAPAVLVQKRSPSVAQEKVKIIIKR